MRNTYTERFDHALEFEAKHQLFSLRYKGLPFWQLIRSDILTSYVNGLPDLSGVHPDSNRSKSNRFPYLKYVLPQAWRQLFMKETDLLLYGSPAKRLVDGRELMPYMDFIAGIQDFSVHRHIRYLEMDWTHAGACASNNAVLCFLIDIGYVARLAARKLRRPDRTMDALSSLLTNELGYPISPRELQHKIIAAHSLYSIATHYYMGLFKNRFRCIVCCEQAYDVLGFAMITAAKELGIPFIEMQHGIISHYNIVYHFRDSGCKDILAPNYLFTYGQYWSDACGMPQGCQCVAVGSPFLAYAKQAYQDVKTIPKTIVFYSSSIVAPQLADIAIAFAAKYAAANGYRMFYKLHPGECRSWRGIYPGLAACEDINCIDTQNSVYEFLAKYEIHVGVESMTMFEALAFGRKPYILNAGASVHMQDILDAGYAKMFSDEDMLWDLIAADGASEPSEIDVSAFYKPDALENTRKALHDVLTDWYKDDVGSDCPRQLNG